MANREERGEIIETYGKDIGNTEDAGNDTRRDDAAPHWCSHVVLRRCLLVEIAEN